MRQENQVLGHLGVSKTLDLVSKKKKKNYKALPSQDVTVITKMTTDLKNIL
jgi:hypothetical protein